MNVTKTCALWNEHRRQHEKNDKELDDCIRAEFPPGTRVRWTHTYDNKTHEPVKREGIVAEFYGYGKVNVRVKANGPKHCLYGYQLELIGATDGVQNTGGTSHG